MVGEGGDQRTLWDFVTPWSRRDLLKHRSPCFWCQ